MHSIIIGEDLGKNFLNRSVVWLFDKFTSNQLWDSEILSEGTKAATISLSSGILAGQKMIQSVIFVQDKLPVVKVNFLPFINYVQHFGPLLRRRSSGKTEKYKSKPSFVYTNLWMVKKASNKVMHLVNSFWTLRRKLDISYFGTHQRCSIHILDEYRIISKSTFLQTSL